MRSAVALLGAVVQTVVLGGLALFLEGSLRLAADAPAVIFLGLAGALCGGEIVLSDRAGAAPLAGRRGSWDHGSARMTGLSLLALFTVSLVEHARGRWPASSSVIALASVMAAAGVAIRLLAVHALGRFFLSEVQIADGQPLIQSGLFGVIRHPSEAGLLLFSLASCVLMGSASGLLVWLVGLLPATFHRVRQEDQLLGEVFGAAFESYRRRVAGLIPGVR